MAQFRWIGFAIPFLMAAACLGADDGNQIQPQVERLFRSWEKVQTDCRSLVVTGTRSEAHRTFGSRDVYRFTLKLLRKADGELCGSYEEHSDKPGSQCTYMGLLRGNSIYWMHMEKKTALRFTPGDKNPRQFLEDHFNPLFVLLDRKQATTTCQLTVVKSDEWYTYLTVKRKESKRKRAEKFLWFEWHITPAVNGRVVLMNKDHNGLLKDMPYQLWYETDIAQTTYEIKGWQYNSTDGPKESDFIKPEDRQGWEVRSGVSELPKPPVGPRPKKS